MSTIPHTQTTNAVSAAAAAAAAGNAPARELPQRYRELTRQDVEQAESSDPRERLPIWVSAVLLVGYCSVFWVGAVTIGGWVLEAVTSLVA